MRSNTPCASSFQLLLILDVKLALSVSMAASAVAKACYLLARGARCRVVQSFTDGMAVRAATSTTPSIFDG